VPVVAPLREPAGDVNRELAERVRAETGLPVTAVAGLRA
jgi:hypothetical protein